jgi:3-oxoadipate enol-lactonase
MTLTGLAALARYTPEQTQLWLTQQLYLQRKSSMWEPWAIQEAASHDWRAVLEAGKALGGFSSTGWIGQVDVPTSIVATTRDQVVPLRRQARLMELIPDATVFRVDAKHDAAVSESDRFVPALRRAIESVRHRVEQPVAV